MLNFFKRFYQTKKSENSNPNYTLTMDSVTVNDQVETNTLNKKVDIIATLLQKHPSQSHAISCIMGAFCGDAIGATLEFYKGQFTPEVVDEALKLEGGGVFGVGPGQITDDSELALCMMRALAESNGVLDLNNIAKWYGKWYTSAPFDIGNTIRAAVSKAILNFDKPADSMRQGTIGNKNSQSNGSLMRITPICIWGRLLPKDQFMKAVREESHLTHYNETANDISVAFACMIRYLLLNQGDYKGAFNECIETIKELQNKELMEWVSIFDKEDVVNHLPRANYSIGSAKIAFLYSLYFLKNNYSYTTAMKEMLSRGGDTDTNCCIIGAALGALHGYTEELQTFSRTVLEFGTADQRGGKTKGIKRPDFLITAKSIGLLDALLTHSPKELVMLAGTDSN